MRDRLDALVSPDVGHELIVVIVAVAPLHRLDVAAVLLVELVDEFDGTVRLAPSAGDPLVPAGDHHERRVERQGTPPLLLEVQPPIDRAGGTVHRPVVEAPAAGVARAHVRHLPVADAEVLRHRDVDLLGRLRVLRVAVDLGIGRLPVPGVGRIHHGERPVGSAEREESPELGTAPGRRLAPRIIVPEEVEETDESARPGASTPRSPAIGSDRPGASVAGQGAARAGSSASTFTAPEESISSQSKLPATRREEAVHRRAFFNRMDSSEANRWDRPAPRSRRAGAKIVTTFAGLASVSHNDN